MVNERVMCASWAWLLPHLASSNIAFVQIVNKVTTTSNITTATSRYLSRYCIFICDCIPVQFSIFSTHKEYLHKTHIQSVNYIKCCFSTLFFFSFVLAMSFKFLSIISFMFTMCVACSIAQCYNINLYSLDTLKIDFLSNDKTRNARCICMYVRNQFY